MKKRKDGLYQMQVTFTIRGQKVTKSFYGHSKSEITRKIAEYREECAASPPFRTVAATWKELRWPELKNGTKMCYSPALDRANAAFGDLKIADVTAADIDRLILTLKSKGLSSKSVKTQKSVLNMIFNFAIVQGYVDTNPVSAVRVPAHLPKSRREIPNDAVLRIVRDSVGLDFGLYPFLLMYTGCRRGEALALQYQDIDRTTKVIHVSKAVTFFNNKAVISDTKTDAGNRTVILLDALAAQIPDGLPEHYLFGGPVPLTEREFRVRWTNYCLAAGLAEQEVTVEKNPETKKEVKKKRTICLITPHQLRHAYATILFEAGLDEFDAKDLMGHTDIRLTREIYTHIRQTRKQKTADQLEQFISTDPF
jgi:integrase